MSRSKRKKLTWYALHVSIRERWFLRANWSLLWLSLLLSPKPQAFLFAHHLCPPILRWKPFCTCDSYCPQYFCFWYNIPFNTNIYFLFNNFITKSEHCLNKIHLFWFKYYTMYSSVRNITHTLFLSNWNELKCCYWFLIGLYFKSVLKLLLYFEWRCKCSPSNFFFYFYNYKGRKKLVEKNKLK